MKTLSLVNPPQSAFANYVEGKPVNQSTMTGTEELLQEIGDLYESLKKIETLLNELNSKVDYLIDIYGLNQDLDKHKDLRDWTGGDQ